MKRESYIEDSRMTGHPRQDSSGIPNLDETVIKHEPVDAGMKIEVWNEQEEEINCDAEDLSFYGDRSEKQIYVKEEKQEDLNVQSDRQDLNQHVSTENYVASSSS